MSKHVDYLIKTASLLGVSDIATVVLNNDKFSIWSGSSNPNTHHYGEGKLAEHTREVVELCLNNAKFFDDQADKKVMFDQLFS